MTGKGFPAMTAGSFFCDKSMNFLNPIYLFKILLHTI